MIRIARTAVLGMTLAVAPAWAQLYKWVDERGVTHYGEKPPASGGAPVTLRDPTGGPKEQPKQQAAPAPRAARKTETDLQRQEREFQRRQERRDQEAAEERRRQEQARSSESSRMSECRTATQDLNTMQRNPTNYSYADQAQARDRIARSCR